MFYKELEPTCNSTKGFDDQKTESYFRFDTEGPTIRNFGTNQRNILISFKIRQQDTLFIDLSITTSVFFFKYYKDFLFLDVFFVHVNILGVNGILIFCLNVGPSTFSCRPFNGPNISDIHDILNMLL